MDDMAQWCFIGASLCAAGVCFCVGALWGLTLGKRIYRGRVIAPKRDSRGRFTK